MNTKLTFTYNGVKYTLEFTRNVVKLLEQEGFKLDEFLDKPMTNIEMVFTSAFITNHKKISQTTIDEIFSKMTHKDDLVAKLGKMIKECYDSLLDEPEEGAEGNISWEVADLSPKTSQK